MDPHQARQGAGARPGKGRSDFAARSLFSESYRFDAIRVVGPQVRAVIGADGKLNLLGLVPPPNPDPLPSVLIADLQVTGGRASFADLTRPGRPVAQLSPIGLSLQNLHTNRDEGGGFRLQGRSDQNESFLWKGKVSLAPIASHGGLVVRDLRAASIQKFAGDLLPLPLADGRIDFELAYAAHYGESGSRARAFLPAIGFRGLKLGSAPALLNADVAIGSLALTGATAEITLAPGGAASSKAGLGGVAVRDVALTGTGPARGQDLTLRAGDITGIGITPATSALAIESIRLAGLETTVTRDPRGNISLMKLVPAIAARASTWPSATSNCPSSTPVRVASQAMRSPRAS